MTNVTVTGSADQPTFSTNNTQVKVNLTNVNDQQTLTINLHGATVGARSGDVSIPMSVLLGDANSSGRTDNGDAIVVRNNSGSMATLSTFRADINTSGRIDNGDAVVIRNNSGHGLP